VLLWVLSLRGFFSFYLGCVAFWFGGSPGAGDSPAAVDGAGENAVDRPQCFEPCLLSSRQMFVGDSEWYTCLVHLFWLTARIPLMTADLISAVPFIFRPVTQTACNDHGTSLPPGG
jgi:hypothetical protein